MVICSQYSLMLLLQLAEGSDGDQHFLEIKYFKLRYVLFFSFNAIAHLIDYSIVQT